MRKSVGTGNQAGPMLSLLGIYIYKLRRLFTIYVFFSNNIYLLIFIFLACWIGILKTLFSF